MSKLKHIGKYFTKGLQAGVLASALVAGNTGCQQPAEYDPWKTYNPAPSGVCFGEKFKRDDEHFYGAYFIGEKENWVLFNNPTEAAKLFYPDRLDKDKEYTLHYYNAKSFMDGMMWQLQWKLNQHADPIKGQTNPLYQTIAASIKQMQDNYGSDIAGDITNYYTALAPVFAEFDKNFDKFEQERFRDCYYLLAYVAYNRSRGAYAHANSKTKTEIAEKEFYFPYGSKVFRDEGTYNSNVGYARYRMGTFIEQIATATQTDAEILTEVVDFALYNESLYGLNDFAKICKVNVHNFKSERTLSLFQNYITAAKNTTQNLDDARTR